MSLTILDPGPYSILVDTGRPGSRSLGVPVGGAADRAAFFLGNALVGNGPNSPALEITLTGPTLRAEHSTACVVFGAPFTLNILNRGPITPGFTFTLEAGETLRIGGTPEGVRGYLCVAGGFEAPEILASRSALEPIRAGDVLNCSTSRIVGRSLPFMTSDQHSSTTIRVLEGPQAAWFTDHLFTEQLYTVSTASNRMGLRLRGEPLNKRAGEMVSEPVAPGAIQITNDGQPIVLGVDGQTIGGYPKIAHVIRADLDRLAQLRPGTGVRFEYTTIEEAETAAQIRFAWLREWQLRCNGV